MDLHYSECDSVENQVQMIVDSIYAKDILRQEFRLSGSVTFESSFELEATRQGQPVEEMLQVSIGANAALIQ
ncbi:hypothetical protein PABG_11807 [Paracoccidioides brasiliensis Pb03]|nr:hypothetical protein PABG_11807 [Paracoccidioides brasiliensis Pb03]